MRFRYDAAAARELNFAVDFFNWQRGGLGNELFSEVEHILELLAENPELGRKLSDTHRSIVLKRFPFRLIYAIDGDTIRTVAIAHQSRRADYWRGRLEESRPVYALLADVA